MASGSADRCSVTEKQILKSEGATSTATARLRCETELAEGSGGLNCTRFMERIVA